MNDPLLTYDETNLVSDIDILWEVSLIIQLNHPAWSGMMQMTHKADHPGLASVMFLPIIDLDLTDMNCVNSTLLYVGANAHRHECTAILTFN